MRQEEKAQRVIMEEENWSRDTDGERNVEIARSCSIAYRHAFIARAQLKNPCGALVQ